jgi:hypothetical protein
MDLLCTNESYRSYENEATTIKRTPCGDLVAVVSSHPTARVHTIWFENLDNAKVQLPAQWRIFNMIADPPEIVQTTNGVTYNLKPGYTYHLCTSAAKDKQTIVVVRSNLEITLPRGAIRF